jgi:hypothetical protein
MYGFRRMSVFRVFRLFRVFRVFSIYPYTLIGILTFCLTLHFRNTEALESLDVHGTHEQQAHEHPSNRLKGRAVTGEPTT